MANFYGDTRGIPLTPFMFDAIYDNTTPLVNDGVALGRYILYKTTEDGIPQDIVYQKVAGSGEIQGPQGSGFAYKEITRLNSGFEGAVQQTLQTSQKAADDAKKAADDAKKAKDEAQKAVEEIQADSLNLSFSQVENATNTVGLTANFVKNGNSGTVGETIHITSNSLHLTLDDTTDPKTLYIESIWGSF